MAMQTHIRPCRDAEIKPQVSGDRNATNSVVFRLVSCPGSDVGSFSTVCIEVHCIDIRTDISISRFIYFHTLCAQIMVIHNSSRNFLKWEIHLCIVKH